MNKWALGGLALGLAAVVAGGIVLVVALTSNRESTADLTRHKFWAVAVTPDDIDAIVSQVERLDRDALLSITPKYEVRVHGGPSSGGDAGVVRIIFRGQDPGRVVVFDMQDYRTRPTRQQILDDFKRKLDEAEFKPAD